MSDVDVLHACLTAGRRCLDLLELWQHLFSEADHRLLIVWGREAGDQVAVADLHVGSEVLHNRIDGADRLVLPSWLDAVGGELGLISKTSSCLPWRDV